MGPVYRRIAIHGGLTAVILGVLGVMFSDLAAMWTAASSPTRTAAVSSNDSDFLRKRVPLMMAVWGFSFVALGEVAKHIWNRRSLTRLAANRQPDPTEQFLEELMTQAENSGSMPQPPMSSDSNASKSRTPTTAT
jgi:hypothetical protein